MSGSVHLYRADARSVKRSRAEVTFRGLNAVCRDIPPSSRSRHTSKRRQQAVQASSISQAAGNGEDDERGRLESDWLRRPAAFTVPAYARRPEHWFVFAAFLKILLITLTWSPARSGTTILGLTFRGIDTLLVLVPAASAMGYLAVKLLQSGITSKRWGAWAIVALSSVLLFLSQSLAARPLPPRARPPEMAQERRRSPLMANRQLRSTEDSDLIFEQFQKLKEQDPNLGMEDLSD